MVNQTKTSGFIFTEPTGATAYPIAKAGYPFIGVSAFVTLILALLELTVPALLALAITGFICLFFRDPDRLIPSAENACVSPADGKVIFIGDVSDSGFSNGPCKKISIFMNLFNVHVNRIPHEGTIKEVRYFPGKFFAASKDKAVESNEHNAVLIETTQGKPYCMVQIAGLVARRILCRVQPQDRVLRGQRMGMICFGSRVDVYFPGNIRFDVAIGTKVKAGHSILGYLQ
jgi:phosphatidylserine decarboxylase